MDAQQRVLLEACWEALAHGAARAADPEAAAAVGVTVGISYNEYYLNSAHRGMSAYTATSGTLSVACGRISFTLGLKVRLASLHAQPSPAQCPCASLALSRTRMPWCPLSVLAHSNPAASRACGADA